MTLAFFMLDITIPVIYRLNCLFISSSTSYFLNVLLKSLTEVTINSSGFTSFLTLK